MLEISAKSDTHASDQRHFDWGPPASATADSFKDWLVYFIIIILLAGGVWALLDINGRRNETVIPARRSAAPAAVPVPVNTAVTTKPAGTEVAAQPQPRFYVQLGAFADEASAREVFNQLEAENFGPTLAEPDEQFEIYRIFVGPYASEAAAEDIAEKLNTLEFHCFVIEKP